MRISDWSSDVCSSDLGAGGRGDAERRLPICRPVAGRAACRPALFPRKLRDGASRPVSGTDPVPPLPLRSVPSGPPGVAMRIAALTDIHAASDPLQLALTAARREG